MAGHLRFKNQLIHFGLSSEDAMDLICPINGPDLSKSPLPFLGHITSRRLGDGVIALTLHYPGVSPEGSHMATIQRLATKLSKEGIHILSDSLGEDGMVHTFWIYPATSQAAFHQGPQRDLDDEGLEEFTRITTAIRKGLYVPHEEQRALHEAIQLNFRLDHPNGLSDDEIAQIRATAMLTPPEPIPARFFCPGCGARLVRDPRTDVDREAYDVFCQKRACSYAHISLRVHHPIHGYESPAGDSWSLSYLK